MFSNDKIISSSDTNTEFKKIDDSLFNLSRYSKFHVIMFIVGNVLIFTLIIFKATVFRFLVGQVSCLDGLKDKYQDMEAVSSDYYKEIHLKTLIHEHERCFDSQWPSVHSRA